MKEILLTSKEAIARIEKELGKLFSDWYVNGKLSYLYDGEHDRPVVMKIIQTAIEEATEPMRQALQWYATAIYPDDGSGRPSEAFQRRAKEALECRAAQPQTRQCLECGAETGHKDWCSFKAAQPQEWTWEYLDQLLDLKFERGPVSLSVSDYIERVNKVVAAHNASHLQ